MRFGLARSAGHKLIDQFLQMKREFRIEFQIGL
jgi:hypothetical protein